MEPMIDRKYLYGHTGRRLTRSLFKETCLTTDSPLMTLGRDTDNGYINLRELFIKFVVDDPSESDFAEAVFGDYSFWVFLCKADWMGEYVEEWRMIADVKRKAKAFKTIIKEVDEEGKSSFTAAKYLIEEPWKVKEAEDKRGARQRIRKTAEQAFEESGISEDVKRLKEQGLFN
jgi:hypothetical protein